MTYIHVYMQAVHLVYLNMLYIVCVRASLSGWLTLHKQTKLVAPSGFIRLGITIALFFALWALG